MNEFHQAHIIVENVIAVYIFIRRNWPWRMQHSASWPWSCGHGQGYRLVTRGPIAKPVFRHIGSNSTIEPPKTPHASFILLSNRTKDYFAGFFGTRITKTCSRVAFIIIIFPLFFYNHHLESGFDFKNQSKVDSLSLVPHHENFLILFIEIKNFLDKKES